MKKSGNGRRLTEKMNLMLRVEKVNKSNKQRIIDILKVDVIKHVFAVYDLQHDPNHTIMYAAFENGNMKGYILIYTALKFPSVILECETDVAKQLLGYAPKNRFILHAPPENLPIIKGKFKEAKSYIENWMLVKKGEAKFFRSDFVHRLHSEMDAYRLFRLLSNREDRTSGTVESNLEFIRKMPTYGVFIGDELVSYASSFLQLPQVWMIGGVYTHPNHRDKGYATLATSAVTEEALKNAESAALFVRSDNYPAIRAYEKIGYKEIGEKLWVDVGTGLKP
ncbi:MAG: GNAT family N-acetyltransferase [Candidatus Bathyarchaeia archaeon]|nr:GNAT family N-acetyltransferase [Candidatus Bathyarchaeia archaeon]